MVMASARRGLLVHRQHAMGVRISGVARALALCPASWSASLFMPYPRLGSALSVQASISRSAPLQLAVATVAHGHAKLVATAPSIIDLTQRRPQPYPHLCIGAL
jgi:hypothetical protein